jgi:hypothetical protein
LRFLVFNPGKGEMNMTLIEKYKVARVVAIRCRENATKAAGKDSPTNDKHTIRCEFIKLENSTWTPALLRLEATYGYYGRSSGYCAMSAEFGRFIAAAITERGASILARAAELAEAEAERGGEALRAIHVCSVGTRKFFKDDPGADDLPPLFEKEFCDAGTRGSSGVPRMTANTLIGLILSAVGAAIVWRLCPQTEPKTVTRELPQFVGGPRDGEYHLRGNGEWIGEPLGVQVLFAGRCERARGAPALL